MSSLHEIAVYSPSYVSLSGLREYSAWMHNYVLAGFLLWRVWIIRNKACIRIYLHASAPTAAQCSCLLSAYIPDRHTENSRYKDVVWTRGNTLVSNIFLSRETIDNYDETPASSTKQDYECFYERQVTNRPRSVESSEGGRGGIGAT